MSRLCPCGTPVSTTRGAPVCAPCKRRRTAECRRRWHEANRLRRKCREAGVAYPETPQEALAKLIVGRGR